MTVGLIDNMEDVAIALVVVTKATLEVHPVVVVVGPDPAMHQGPLLSCYF
jgi:hypothetical protein